MKIYELNKKEKTFALYGLMMGDGYYQNGSIYCKHTNKQKFYIEWLENFCLQNNISYNCNYNYLCKTTFGKLEYSSIRIKVPNKFYFENEKSFYKNNKKNITDFILDNINELGLLLWFLDDGQWHVSFKNNKSKRFGYLNTQCFTFEENKKIVDMFKKRFDIDLKIHTDNSGFEKYKEKKYYRIYFNAENFRKFFDLVRPFLKDIPKEFYYKFDMKYRPNRLKDSLLFSQKYNLS